MNATQSCRAYFITQTKELEPRTGIEPVFIPYHRIVLAIITNEAYCQLPVVPSLPSQLATRLASCLD